MKKTNSIRQKITMTLTASLMVAGMLCLGGSQAEAKLKWNGVRINGVKFNGVRMNGVKFNGVRMNGVKFNGAKMSQHIDVRQLAQAGFLK